MIESHLHFFQEVCPVWVCVGRGAYSTLGGVPVCVWGGEVVYLCVCGGGEYMMGGGCLGGTLPVYGKFCTVPVCVLCTVHCRGRGCRGRGV